MQDRKINKQEAEKQNDIKKQKQKTNKNKTKIRSEILNNLYLEENNR